MAVRFSSPYLSGEQSELDFGGIRCARADDRQGGNLSVDQRPELTIILRMVGISPHGRNPMAQTGGKSPRPGGKGTS